MGRMGFRRTGDGVPRRVLRLSAAAEHRPVGAQLHGAQLRPGRGQVQRTGQLPHRRGQPDVRAGPHQHRGVHPGVPVLPVRHRAGARGVLPAALPALRHAPGVVPGALAAAADRVGVDLGVDAQQRFRPGELRAGSGRRATGALAHLPAVEPDLGHLREHLDRHPLQSGGPAQRPAGDPGGDPRSRRDRRRECLAAVLAGDVPAPAAGVGHHAVARPGVHAEGLRHHLDHDKGRPGRLLDDADHLVLPQELRVPAPAVRPRGGDQQPADPAGPGRRAAVRALGRSGGGHVTANRAVRGRRLRTAVGVVLTAVMLFPVYWMINVSLTPTQDMRHDPPFLLPVHATLDGYRTVLDQQLPYLWASLLVGFGTVAITLLVSAPAGYSLAKLRARGGSALGFALLMAQMIPGIIMGIGFYAIYLNLGYLNTLPGLVLADSTIAVPFGVLLFTSFMRGIPDELLQAAKVDGAGHLRTFLSVVLPVSRNAVVTVSLFSFLWAWSDFIFATTLDSGGDHQPITLGIYHYIGNNNQEWNAIMATAVVASVPATVLLIVAQRYVAAGVTVGAVKD